MSIQHAAVNYPLSDYGQYIPNLPTKLYNDTRVVDDDKFSVLRLPNGDTSAVSMNFNVAYLNNISFLASRSEFIMRGNRAWTPSKHGGIGSVVVRTPDF